MCEATMSDTIDTVFEWKSSGNYESNKCRIRIYWLTWDKAIVIATDLGDHFGHQIANATKEIISFATDFYHLAPNKTMLVEHYIKDDLSNEDTYLQVLLVNNEPIRFEMAKSKLIKLIGREI